MTTPNPGTAELKEWLESKSHNVWHDTLSGVDRYECNLTIKDLKALIDQQRQKAKQEAMQELIDKVREGWEFRPGQEGQMVLDDMLRQRDALLGKETK